MTLRYCSSAVDNSLAPPPIFPFFSVFSNSSLGIMLLVKKMPSWAVLSLFCFFHKFNQRNGNKGSVLLAG